MEQFFTVDKFLLTSTVYKDKLNKMVWNRTTSKSIENQGTCRRWHRINTSSVGKSAICPWIAIPNNPHPLSPVALPFNPRTCLFTPTLTSLVGEVPFGHLQRMWRNRLELVMREKKTLFYIFYVICLSLVPLSLLSSPWCMRNRL